MSTEFCFERVKLKLEDSGGLWREVPNRRRRPGICDLRAPSESEQLVLAGLFLSYRHACKLSSLPSTLCSDKSKVVESGSFSGTLSQ